MSRIYENFIRTDQVVAPHDDVLPPPQDAARHDEVFLLGFVSEESPLPGGDGVVREPGSSGNGQVLGRVVHGGVLREQGQCQQFRKHGLEISN